MSMPLGFTAVDCLALLFFLFVWLLFEILPNRAPWYKRSISYHMGQFREDWMKNMVVREPQVLDALIQSSLQQGIGFFASTSILVIGALFAALGASEEALKILGDFPFTVTTTQTQWEFKVLLLIVTFAFAFFKFAWALRLFNYVSILVGASPHRSDDEILKNDYAIKLARLHSLGARHFTTGINAYFFALAAIAWFINPWAFIIATLWVALVMYRRTFRSNFSKILSSTVQDTDPGISGLVDNSASNGAGTGNDN